MTRFYRLCHSFELRKKKTFKIENNAGNFGESLGLMDAGLDPTLHKTSDELVALFPRCSTARQLVSSFHQATRVIGLFVDPCRRHWKRSSTTAGRAADFIPYTSAAKKGRINLAVALCHGLKMSRLDGRHWWAGLDRSKHALVGLRKTSAGQTQLQSTTTKQSAEYMVKENTGNTGEGHLDEHSILFIPSRQ